MAADKPDEKQDEPKAEVETERGFGTGLRAQLERRRDGATVTASEVTEREKGDTPFVRVDLYATPPPETAPLSH